MITIHDLIYLTSQKFIILKTKDLANCLLELYGTLKAQLNKAQKQQKINVNIYSKGIT